jgi:oxalate decarboxylase/phosphoglucose isomerase-like protein (cupin superfamily)
MSSFIGSRAGAVALVIALAACKDGSAPVQPRTTDGISPAATSPSFTLASGSTSTLLGRATFSQPDEHGNSGLVDIRRTTGTWQIDIKAKPNLDLAVQSITFAPGAQSGWHSHPGPVFIQVVSGTMTFYESDDPTCTPNVKTAGQGYLDMGDHAHIARNETATPAQNIVTYFAPTGAALRIDQPSPGNCPF